MPKERPILFNGDMVRALLDGRKTQTRRVMKVQPEPTPDDYTGQSGHWFPCRTVQAMVHVERDLKAQNWELAGTCCPYGDVGDRLWVRETWGVVSHAFDANGNRSEYHPDRPATPVQEMPFGKCYYHGHVIYAADGGFEWSGDDDGGGDTRSAWKPSIHMPRIASRITLEIVSVRVERLQDISPNDCIEEGAWRIEDKEIGRGHEAVDAYRALWESINGADSWEANPWVWVVEFKRMEYSQ